MAVWQFDCVVIPSSACVSVSAKDLFDDSSSCWDTVDAESLRAALQRLGAMSPHWNAAVSLWGSLESTCVMLDVDDERIFELRLRVDLRNPDIALVRGLLDVCSMLELTLVTAHERVAPAAGALVAAWQKSEAAEFIQQPYDYLETLLVN